MPKRSPIIRVDHPHINVGKVVDAIMEEDARAAGQEVDKGLTYTGVLGPVAEAIDGQVAEGMGEALILIKRELWARFLATQQA